MTDAQMPTTILLNQTETALRAFNLHTPDEDLSIKMNEWTGDLWNAFHLYPDATEHMQSLSTHVNAMYAACKEQRLDGAERERRAALAPFGPLCAIAAQRGLR